MAIAIKIQMITLPRILVYLIRKLQFFFMAIRLSHIDLINKNSIIQFHFLS